MHHTTKPRPPLIIGSLVDVPNLITLIGGFLAMIAIVLAMRGNFSGSLIIILWAHLADSYDGWAARKQVNRSPQMAAVGKQLDSMSDLLMAGAYPLVLLVALTDGNIIGMLSGFLLCVAGLLRLSFFNVHGLSDGGFSGLPLPHNVAILAFAYFSSAHLMPDHIGLVLTAVGIITSIAHISQIRFPKTPDSFLLPQTVIIGAISLFYLLI